MSLFLWEGRLRLENSSLVLSYSAKASHKCYSLMCLSTTVRHNICHRTSFNSLRVLSWGILFTYCINTEYTLSENGPSPLSALLSNDGWDENERATTICSTIDIFLHYICLFISVLTRLHLYNVVVWSSWDCQTDAAFRICPLSMLRNISWPSKHWKQARPIKDQHCTQDMYTLSAKSQQFDSKNDPKFHHYLICITVCRLWIFTSNGQPDPVE